MFALARHQRRLTALTLSAVVASTLTGFIGCSGGEAPASSRPAPVAVQLSPSGKIIDRLQNGSAAEIHFAERLARPQPVELIALDTRAGSVSPSLGELAIAPVTATHIPSVSAKTRALETPARKPPRTAARPNRTPIALASSLPPRPATRQETQKTAEVAVVKERRVSVAGRMIAFVGSLASFARVL